MLTRSRCASAALNREKEREEKREKKTFFLCALRQILVNHVFLYDLNDVTKPLTLFQSKKFMPFLLHPHSTQPLDEKHKSGIN